jgi:hypothetical protein
MPDLLQTSAQQAAHLITLKLLEYLVAHLRETVKRLSLHLLLLGRLRLWVVILEHQDRLVVDQEGRLDVLDVLYS